MPVYLQANLFGNLTELVKGKRGDTFSDLAESFYGWANLWAVIYEENQMNHHPDRIYPAQKFIIP